MRLGIRIVAIAISISATGCATTIIGTNEAKETSRRFAAFSTQYSEPIVVKRNTSFAGSACFDRVFADGRPIADLGVGEKVDFTLPPGRHLLGVEKQGICPGQMREIAVELQDGKLRTFFVDVSVTGEFIFQETAF
jgi:hypothetical protein